ncbi:hypothetical protein AGIG_G9603 [Arapaima gigas]
MCSVHLLLQTAAQSAFTVFVGRRYTNSRVTPQMHSASGLCRPSCEPMEHNTALQPPLVLGVEVYRASAAAALRCKSDALVSFKI